MSGERRSARPAIPLGATTETVARNLHRLRQARGFTARSLSKALNDAGRPISPDAIIKIENCARPDAKHQRRVDVDDLMTLAAVLNVSPSALLLPLVDAATASVEVTGGGKLPADVAWDWLDGKRPLHLPAQDDGTASLEYALHSRPPGRRNAL